MGLFGSKYVTTVGTSVQRVINDDNIPDSVLEGWVANFANSADMSLDYIKDKMIDSLPVKINRMYNYAKSGYKWGVPSGVVYDSFSARAAVKAVIESTKGPVQIAYYFFGPLNNLHTAWKVLTENYQYNYQTNVITSLNKTINGVVHPVYLKDMQVIVTDATLEELANGSMDQWGTAPNAGTTPSKQLKTEVGALKGATPFAVDPAATKDYVKVTTEWEVDQVIFTSTFNIPMEGYDFAKDYHMAEWVSTSTGTRGFFTYKYGSGQTDLDKVFDAEYNDQGNFLPLLYFRYDKKNEATDKTSDSYLQAKKMSKYMNIDYDTLNDSIHENPDIADVQQAFMMFGIPADTTNAVERKYLFDFFSGLALQTNASTNNTASTADYTIRNLLQAYTNVSTIVIQDKRFKMALQWRNIVKRKVAGKIGAVGTYMSGAGSLPSDITVPALDGTTRKWDTSTKSHWVQKQITDSVYEEVIVFGLAMVYYIIDGYTTTGGDDNEAILLIPIDTSMAKSYNITDREELYSRALHMVFNSVVVTKLKWYQTGLFRVVMLIIAIVITFFSYGTTWQSIGAALAAGTITLTVVITALIEELIKYLIVMIAIKLFVKLTNWKFALVVAMIVAAAYGYDTQGAYFDGMVQAKDLVTVSTGLMKEAGLEINKEIMDVANEMSEFAKESKKALQTLEDTTSDLLSQNDRLAPLIIWGETPDQFFDRTLHYGNIGTYTLDMVSNYVDASLRLPEISDTLLGARNG